MFQSSLWPLILTWLKSHSTPKNIPSLPMMIWHLVVKFIWDPFIFTQAITPNVPFVVWNLVMKFYQDQPTNNQVIQWKVSTDKDNDNNDSAIPLCGHIKCRTASIKHNSLHFCIYKVLQYPVCLSTIPCFFLQ